MKNTGLCLNWIFIIIPLLGLSAQWISWYFRLPAIVLLSAAGILFGPILGIVQPEVQFGGLLSPLINASVALILFEGGLNLRLFEFKEAGSGVRRLIFPGVPIAWGLYSLCTHYIGGINWHLALVFGAIIVVSGPTVIGPLLRQAHLKRRVASYIKWEGIINDPIGALLAVIVFQYYVFTFVGEPWHQIFWCLLRGCIVALALGAGGSYLLARAFLRGYVPEYLKRPIIFCAVLIISALSNAAQDEAGLLASTLFGLVLGNAGLPSIGEVRRFNESLCILLISCVFILLTANLDFASMLYLNWRCLLTIFTIIFVARPLTILFSTWGSVISYRERLLLACIAPRGIIAAAIGGVFAYRLEEIGCPQTQLLVPMLFSTVFASVVVYGFTFPYIAKRLNLAAKKDNGLLIVGASQWSIEFAATLTKHQIPVVIVDSSWNKLKSARMQNLTYIYGQALSEELENQVDMSEIGYALAASDNDAFNILVCSHFSHEFGRNKVLHLPMLDTHEQGRRASFQPSLSTQKLFLSEWSYADLQNFHDQGFRFQSTKFTDLYSSEQYFADFSKSILVVLIRHDGTLSFFTKNNQPNPQSGDILISYAPSIVNVKKTRQSIYSLKNQCLLGVETF